MKTEINETNKKKEEVVKEKYEPSIFRIIRIIRHPIREYHKWKERREERKLLEEKENEN